MVSWVPPAWGPHRGLRLSRMGSWGTRQAGAGMAAQPGASFPQFQFPRHLGSVSWAIADHALLLEALQLSFQLPYLARGTVPQDGSLLFQHSLHLPGPLSAQA